MNPHPLLFFNPLPYVVVLNAALCWLAAVGLSGCGGSGVEEAGAEDFAKSSDSPAATDSEGRGDYLALIKRRLPARGYATNELLPDDGYQPAPRREGNLERIRVGLPWVLNDEAAPWFIAQEKGFFREAGLEAELLPGGPGYDYLKLLAGGQVEVAIIPNGVRLPLAVASRTRLDAVAIGTFLKHSPSAWIGLDQSIPRDRRSDRVLIREDFIGVKVGLVPERMYAAQYVERYFELPSGSIATMRGGFSAEPLILGAYQYYGGWIINQTRLLEAQGYYNWTALMMKDIGLDEPTDVSVVERNTFETRRDLLRRYLWAIDNAISYLLAEPREAARITQRYATGSQLSLEQIEQRFSMQRPLITGENPEEPLQYMDLDIWDRSAAVLFEYGQLEVEE